jgi:hypothetical protein
MAEEATTRSKSLAIGQLEVEPKKHEKSLTEDPVQTSQILSLEEEEEEEKNEHNNEVGKGDGEEEETEEREIKRGPLYRCLVSCHCRCLARFIDTWPRVSSFILGVLLPLWGLIMISTIFGTWLANVEAPTEIEQNDAALAETAKLNLMANLFANISSLAMALCLWIDQDTNSTRPPIEELKDFLNTYNRTLNETQLEEILAQASDIINDISTNFTPGALDGGEDIYVTVSAATFMECTERVRNLTSVMNGILAKYAMEIDDPTFNWIRCSDDVNETDFIIPFPDLGSPGDPSYKPVRCVMIDQEYSKIVLDQSTANSTCV